MRRAKLAGIAVIAGASCVQGREPQNAWSASKDRCCRMESARRHAIRGILPGKGSAWIAMSGARNATESLRTTAPNAKRRAIW